MEPVVQCVSYGFKWDWFDCRLRRISLKSLAKLIRALAPEYVPLQSLIGTLEAGLDRGACSSRVLLMKYLADWPPLTAAIVRVEYRGNTPK